MIALDIGCGIGRLEKVLSSYFRVIYGVDVSPKMIEIAEQRLKGLRNVRLCVNNGLDLSLFRDSSFDFVFSYLTFQHVPRWVTYGYFREAYRVLRPDGIFRFQVWNRELLTVSLRWLLKLIRKRPFDVNLDPPDHDTWTIRFYSQEELYPVLKRVGFRQLRFERIRRVLKPPERRLPYYSTHLWVTCRK